MKQEKKIQKTKNIPWAYFLGMGLSLIFEFVGAAFLGWWLGNQIDRKLGTDPYAMIFFLIVFMLAALTHLIIVFAKLQKSIDSYE